jgi:hypothetical protein
LSGETFEEVAERRDEERSLAKGATAKDATVGVANVSPGEALFSKVIASELQR